ncbi:MAG: hypothetical protein EA371_03075 [Gammaproteobacteria bacterium]|nr:MAG: hypothetical protein EA371_03075 [Gammaproteobacteria bacterium]
MGSYTYGNGAKPYAVTAAGGTSYAYDANGRMTSRGGAAITWYSYDLPRRINYGSGSGAVSSEFFYGTGRSRYKQLRRAGASVSAAYGAPGTQRLRLYWRAMVRLRRASPGASAASMTKVVHL